MWWQPVKLDVVQSKVTRTADPQAVEWPVAVIRPLGAGPESAPALRALVIPAHIWEQFESLARQNTEASPAVETIGYLFGPVARGSSRLRVSVLFVPHQEGTPDSCAATLDGSIAMSVFKDQEDLTMLGWIHVSAGRARAVLGHPNLCEPLPWLCGG